MRIRLDYYRILGIPLNATAGQIKQAHADRYLQLPRREYSQEAIGSRQGLLDEAYSVLSSPERRAAHDRQFFASENNLQPSPYKTYTLAESFPADPTPRIDIEESRVIGALLILQELGEYETVISIGENIPNPDNDTLLTLALAYMEIGREKWQEFKSERKPETMLVEQAATATEKALEYLENTDFKKLEREIYHDYYRLRPYRISELLGRELEEKEYRHRGLILLKELLDERQGIDGRGNDRSGLNIDDFLRFIQQSRENLTLDEQYEIFERESRRPSAVAEYLLVYVLIAAGLTRKEPGSIVRAGESLEKLRKYQDVSLEQSICALLLGKTELAVEIIKNIPEREVLESIEEKSTGEPDLLPGLCSYAEKWLTTEVLAKFKDLADFPVSLQDYFADEKVQATLENLGAVADLTMSGISRENQSPGGLQAKLDDLESEITIISATPPTPVAAGVTSMPAYSYPEDIPEYSLPDTGRGRGNRAKKRNQNRRGGDTLLVTSYRQPFQNEDDSSIAVREKLPETVPKPGKRTRKVRKVRKLRLDRIAILGVGFFGTIAALSFGVRAVIDSNSPLSALQGDQLSIDISTPVIEIPKLAANAVESDLLTEEGAREVIQGWLTAKGQVFGKDRQIDKLNSILVDPALSLWQKRAKALGKNNYWEYEHKLEILSVKNSTDRKSATVEGKVTEKANNFQNGQLYKPGSYNDTLKIRYDLVRSGDKWLIKNSQIIK